MTDREQIIQLINLLNNATKEYETGHPTMSDKEWDDLYFCLETLEKKTGIILKNSPTQSIQYEVKDKLDKIKHDHLMLSLDKTKDIEVVKSFLGNKDWVALAKMDGLTCSLTYENGVLVRAETRGNGIVGEDILHNAKVIPSIPKTIPYNKKLVIDGEIICKYDEFEKHNQDFKNPRNYAAGSIRLLDSRECKKRNLMFVAWDVMEFIEIRDHIPYAHSLIIQLGQTEDWGFTTPPVTWNSQTFGQTTVEDAIDYVKNYAEELKFPIDGIVFKFDDLDLREELGYTSHHFNNAIAYKFYDEEYDTVLRDIEWSMGRTGILTPVAFFDPVDDGDSIITRASLHNISVMKELLGTAPFNGQKIRIAKMNMIIPQIVAAEKSD